MVVAVGVSLALVSWVVTFHIVTMLVPVVAVGIPMPTKIRSVVPSKNSVIGEQRPVVVPFRLTCLLLDMAGVVFANPVVALKLIAKRSCAAAFVESVPQLYRVDAALFGPLL